MSRLLKYDNLRNIRDLGGMKSADGRAIADGKLIRSGNLEHVNESEISRLADLVDTVIDLRDAAELRERPDAVIPGVSYYHISILDSQAAGITREKGSEKEIFAGNMTKPKEMKQMMSGLYTGFARDSAVVSKYAEFVQILLENHEKAVLWHCAAGKDRAGIAAAIIEEILGIPRQAIIEDYLKTNEYLAADIKMLTQLVKKEENISGPAVDEALKYLFGAEREYIESYYHEVDIQFGSFSGFLHEGLKLTDADIKDLRAKYLRDCNCSEHH